MSAPLKPAATTDRNDLHPAHLREAERALERLIERDEDKATSAFKAASVWVVIALTAAVIGNPWIGGTASIALTVLMGRGWYMARRAGKTQERLIGVEEEMRSLPAPRR